MPQLKVEKTWMISLTNAELVLILKALGGRTTASEGEACRILGDYLTRLRGQQLKDLAKDGDRLVEAAGQSRGLRSSTDDETVVISTGPEAGRRLIAEN